MAGTHTAAPKAAPDQAGRLARIRYASLGLVSMLIIEFILGVVYNLYGTAPTSGKSIGLFSSPVLALHVILGILLFVAAVMLLVRSVGARHRLAIWMAAVGLAGIVAAGGAGLGFAKDGANGASLGMSIAFAVSLACYVVVLVAVPGPGSGFGSDSGSVSGSGRSSTT
jgi:hypothetical protein